MLEEIERMGMVQEEGRGEKRLTVKNVVESSIGCGPKGPENLVKKLRIKKN